MPDPSTTADIAAPVASFAALDWFVVLLYMALVTGIGLWMARGQTSKRDYFLGGRSMSWWMVGLAIVATETSALTFIGVPAMAFGTLKITEAGGFTAESGNMFFILLIVGYVIGRIIIAWKIVPLYFHGDVYTPYQLLSRAFGNPARYTASILQLVAMTLGAGVRVLVTAIPVTIVLQVTWPEWSIWMSVVVIMAAAMIYTAIGGIRAVVWTDMIQYFIFVAGGLFALFYIPTLLTGPLAAPSGAEGWSAVREVASDNLRWWNLGLDTSKSLVENVVMVLGSPPNIIMGIFPSVLGIIFAMGFDQLNVQRVLGCRNEREGGRAMILSGILILPQFLLFLLIGAALYAYYKTTGFVFGADPWDPTKVDKITGIGTPKSDYVFPIFIITHVPVVLKGFLLAGILAAAMSSVSSALSAMGSMVTMDLFRPLVGGKLRHETEIWVSRGFTFCAGLALIGVAIWSQENDGILNFAFTLAGLTAGGILGAFIYAMVFRSGAWQPVVGGMLFSLLFMTTYYILREVPSWAAHLGVTERPWWVLNTYWIWHPLIGMMACWFGIAVLDIFFGEHTDRDITRQEAEEG